MSKKTKILTKAEFAAELQCAKSTITHYIRRGMPVRRDGRIDRTAALEWLMRAAGYGGGWGTRRGAALIDRVKALLEGGPVERASRSQPEPDSSASPERNQLDPCALCEAVRRRFTRLPQLLLEFEPDAPAWLVAVIGEFADSAAGAIEVEVDFSGPLWDFPELIRDDQKPLPPVHRSIFDGVGRKVTAAEWKTAQARASEFIDRVDAVLYSTE